MAPFENNTLTDPSPTDDPEPDHLGGDTEVVVAHSSSSWMMLQKLARSDDVRVRAFVAGNPRTSVAGMLTVLGATLPPVDELSSVTEMKNPVDRRLVLSEN